MISTETMHRLARSAIGPVLVLLALALAAGCTSGSDGPAATPAATGTVAPAGTGPSGGVVGHERLTPFVPRAAGSWTLEGDPEGSTMKDSNGRDYTWVTGTYARAGDENAQATLVISDNGDAATPLREQWQSFATIDTNEISMRQVTVDGQPAWRIIDKETNDVSMMVLVGDRFIVWVQVSDGSEADLDALVDAIDFAGLAAVR
jgi:hypothetical protein